MGKLTKRRARKEKLKWQIKYHKCEKKVDEKKQPPAFNEKIPKHKFRNYRFEDVNLINRRE